MYKTILTILIIFSLFSCNQKINSVSEINIKRSVKDSLTLEIEELNNENFFNGLAVAIVDSTGILYEKGFGYSNVELKKPYEISTVQPIASVSKTFIGVALLKAQEKGLLDLDDSINKHLPFIVKNPNFPDEPITIRQLATHTSTIIDTDDYMNRSYVLIEEVDNMATKTENIPQRFNSSETKISLSNFLKNYLSEQGEWYSKDAFSQTRPGQTFEYTNVGASLAAYIVEVVSQKSYAEFTSDHILKPLKMNSSAWSYNDIQLKNASTLYSSPTTPIPFYSLITYPDGGFLTTIDDLGKYLSELIKGYSGRGTLLSNESYSELFREQLNAENFSERNANHPYNDEYNTGIFVGFSAMKNIGHTGGDPGVSSLMFFNSEDKIGRILLVNTNIENQDGVNAYYGIFDKMGEFSGKLTD